MFLLAVSCFWEENFKKNSSLSLEALLFDAESPGRIFMLDENAILDQIYKVAKISSKFVDWSETAGMRQFTRKPTKSLENIKKHARELIEKEYLSS
jgi:hypothetical protein